jgi:drug/metabolite transporter superfamily protein YnfA
MSIDTFYAVVGGIGFTLHGLWWVVVHDRPEWSRNRSRRLLAYVVGLHLLIPAMTSVLSLIAPDEPFVWRASFVTAGLVGILGVVLVLRAIREDMDAPGLAKAVQYIVLPVYAVITILALDPTLPARLGLGLTALQVEAIVVAILIFFGVEAAWVMMVEPRTTELAEGGADTTAATVMTVAPPAGSRVGGVLPGAQRPTDGPDAPTTIRRGPRG